MTEKVQCTTCKDFVTKLWCSGTNQCYSCSTPPGIQGYPGLAGKLDPEPDVTNNIIITTEYDGTLEICQCALIESNKKIEQQEIEIKTQEEMLKTAKQKAREMAKGIYKDAIKEQPEADYDNRFQYIWWNALKKVGVVEIVMGGKGERDWYE